MADTKITDLTELDATPESTDIIYIIDDPGGTPLSKKITITNLLASVTPGADENFVTDAEKTVIGNTSGTNSGDNAVNSNYSGLVSNANHTGDVTGSTALTIADNAVTLAKMTGGTDGNLITYDASGDPAYVTTGTADQVLTSNGAGAAPTFQSAAVSDPILGYTNKSAWADDEEIEITLDTDMSGFGKAHVSVYEEIPTESITNNAWDITTGDTGFTLEDTAYAVTLTPAATSGDEISFTLGSGSWAATDVGKIIKNVSAAETGEARILSIASGVATCQISTAFTDTNAIASGDWEMYAGEFVNGAFELGSAVDQTAIPRTSSVFESAIIKYTSVAMLSATKAIVCFEDVGNSEYGTARILNISDGTITSETPAVFESAAVSYVSVTALSSTQAIVCYRDEGNSDYGTACLLNISGDTITPETPVVFESATTIWTSVTALSSSKAIVCYHDNANSFYGTACILSISGDTITPKTPVVFESATTQYISVTALSSTQAIVCYQDSALGTACLLNISGDTITPETPVVFVSATVSFVSVVMLSSTQAIVCYRAISNYGYACLLGISGDTITPETPDTFYSGNTQYISAAAMKSNKVIVAYRDAGNWGRFRILDISGTTITESGYSFNSATTSYISTVALSSSKAIVCYQDGGNGSYGYNCVVDTESNVYVDDQHIPTISGTDSVDTTLYTDLDSITTIETLNDQTINYAFSFNPTFTSNEVSGGTFVIFGTGQSTERNIISSLNSVHGGTEGVWYYNSNATYGSETWTVATTNNPYAALAQAMTVAANQMSGTDVGNVADSSWPDFGTDFAASIILHTDDDTVTPSADKISFDYSANVYNRENPNYEINLEGFDTVKVTAPSTGGPRNARVYISK